MTIALARADRRGRRDRPRPPDPRATRWRPPAPTPSSSTSARSRRRRASPRRASRSCSIDRAREGKLVVRLKGGDPFVFGRGGEEAEALAAAGIPFEVVPGVTAGIAAPAYAGIPVTHRDDASAVAFVTGHEDPEKEDSALDYEALARFPGTLVFYMGVKALPRIAESADRGRPGPVGARRSGRAGHAARPAHRHRDARGHRRRGRGGRESGRRR